MMKCRYYVNLALLRVDKEFIRLKDIREHDYLELFVEYYSSIYCDNPFEALSLSKNESKLIRMVNEKGIDTSYQNLEIIGKKIGSLEDEYTFIDKRTNNIVFIYARTTRQTKIQQRIDNLLFNEMDKEVFIDELESFIDYLNNSELIEFVESNYIEELKLRDFIFSSVPPLSEKVNALHQHIIHRYNSSYDSDLKELNHVPFIVKSRSKSIIEALEEIELTHKENTNKTRDSKYRETLSIKEVTKELDSSSDITLEGDPNSENSQKRGTALERFNKRVHVDSLESVLNSIKDTEYKSSITETPQMIEIEEDDPQGNNEIEEVEEIKVLDYEMVKEPK